MKKLALLILVLLTFSIAGYAQDGHEFAPLQEKTVNYKNWTLPHVTSDEPQDLRELWAQATETHGWLGRPTSLTLYDNRAHSELAGHEGCHLIATGESGRELWLQLPEPDTFDRLSPGAARVRYTGAFTEYESIKASIFRAVGLDIDPPDDRPWRDRILGRHQVQPAVVHWP